MDIECPECLRRIKRTNQTALSKTLRALTLGPEHSATIAHAKTLASLIDAVPYETKIHTEYREIVKRLVEAGRPETGDAFAELLEVFNATVNTKADTPSSATTGAGA